MRALSLSSTNVRSAAPLSASARSCRRELGGAGVAAVRRLDGVDLHGAADRVAARERALRPARDLDAVDVEQLDHRSREIRIVDLVDVHADAGLERVVEVGLADAADERDHRAARGLAGRRHRDVRRLIGDVDDVRLAAALEHRGVHRRDRDRRVLHVRFAERRRDDDLVELRGCGAGVQCHRRPSSAAMTACVEPYSSFMNYRLAREFGAIRKCGRVFRP